MNKQKFIAFQRSIDNEFLEEVYEGNAVTASPVFRRILPLAACLCLVLFAGMWFTHPARKSAAMESYSLAAPTATENNASPSGKIADAPSIFLADEAEPEAASAEEAAAEAAMGNPMTVFSAEEFEALAGPVQLPESAEDIFYYSISLTNAAPIYAVRFYISTAEYELRKQTSSSLEPSDISGVFFIDPEKASQTVGDFPAEAAVENGMGRLTWSDTESGTEYSLYISENASPELLSETAELLLGVATAPKKASTSYYYPPSKPTTHG